jgi:hypothetical protein
MSKVTNLAATREALRNLVRIVEETHQTLSRKAQASGRPEPLSPPRARQTGQLAETLEHLEDVREGFILSQRTGAQISMTELRQLVRHVLMDWQFINDLNLVLDPGGELETLGDQLVAYNHALVALAVLPRLPSEAITFPQPKPTYCDLSAPVSPGETLARIEEIEQTIYQAEVRPVRGLDYGPFRRTYAFFEASHWLARNHLAPLLDA